MRRYANRRRYASATNVALGCTAIAIVISIAALSGDFYSGGGASSSLVALRSNNAIPQNNLSPTELYELVAPSVVTIIVKDEDGERIGSGSGFFIGEGSLPKLYDWLGATREDFLNMQNAVRNHLSHAYVLSNYHVIRPAVELDIVLSNGDTVHVSSVLAEDEQADLALLLSTWPAKPLKGIPLALDDPRILATVYAIGSPHGLQGSASEGKVSAYRDFGDGRSWLQTTAPISPGSSGGPLLSADGRLVGITTSAIPEAQNVNFAIPITSVRTFLESTPLQPRNVWEGASVRWQEETAFIGMRNAINSPRYSDTQRNAFALLRKAGAAVEDGILGMQNNESRKGLAHFDQATRMAEEANKSLPEEFKYFAHYVAGKSSVLAAWRWAEASISYQETTIDNVESRIANQFKARYRASDDAQAAVDHLVQAIRLNAEFSPAYQWLTIHYAQSGNWANALLASDALVKLMPRCAEAFRRRAECYLELNKAEAAINDYRAALELSPSDWRLHLQLARMLCRNGDYGDAIDSYEAALGLAESELMKSRIFYDTGIAYKRLGRFEKAISAFRKAKTMGFTAIMCDLQIAECKQQQR